MLTCAILRRGLGLAATDIVDAAWVDNGPGWVALLLRDAATVLDIEPDRVALTGFDVGVVGQHPAGSDAAIEVRAFVPTVGTGEDPVTGSLHAGLGRWLIDTGRLPTAYTATQGTCLGRRGRVHVEQVGDDLWVGGATHDRAWRGAGSDPPPRIPSGCAAAWRAVVLDQRAAACASTYPPSGGRSCDDPPLRRARRVR